MASSSSEVIDTTILAFDLSFRKSTTNMLDYLYEISHVPEDSKIPIIDFPIVNAYTVFDKPQASFKKIHKNVFRSFSTFYCKRICPSLTSIIFQQVKQKFSLPLPFPENLKFHGLNKDTHTFILVL